MPVSNVHMKKLFCVFFAVELIMSSCSDHEDSNCISGTIIGYEECTNAVLIQVESGSPIGGSLTYYDQTVYENVVRAPGPIEDSEAGTIYFTYRAYNHESDKKLFENSEPCLAIYAPFDVPTIVVTGFSAVSCNTEVMLCEHEFRYRPVVEQTYALKHQI